MSSAQVYEISQVIQLAVAPVFLLAGISGFLSILSHRLSRSVDRARVVDRLIHEVDTEEHLKHLKKEYKILLRRTSVINWAIRLSVGSALMICLVIMCLFVGDFTSLNLSEVIAYLFIVAMVMVIFSLLLLIYEVNISTKNIRHSVVETINY